ncbi:hypothetical protein ABBQ32_001901 [Trebouxia sp. C0010 RCD-2024]
MIGTFKATLTAAEQAGSLPHCCHRPPICTRLSPHPYAVRQRYLLGGQCRIRIPGDRKPSLKASGHSTSIGEPHQYGLMIECDGVLVDIHKDCHRVAFNKAFEELGLDCVAWAPAVYHDLLRSGDGTAEGIVAAYFGMVGWPMMLPSKERRQFAGKVHDLKKKHLNNMVMDGKLPLRPGIAEFIDAALVQGAAIGLLAGTCSIPEEQIMTAALFALGEERTQQLHTFTCSPQQPSQEGEDDVQHDSYQGLSLEQSMAAARARMKQNEAAAFVETIKGPQWGGEESTVAVNVDPGMLAAMQRATLISPGWLAACTATMGTSLNSMAVLAANNNTMQAAQGAGMLSVAVPPALSARGRFPAADSTFDGFGYGGGLNWPRLQMQLDKRLAGKV